MSQGLAGSGNTGTRAEDFVLGVDLDGVCADFMKGLRPIAAEWLCVPESTLTESPSNNYPEWGLEAAGGFEGCIDMPSPGEISSRIFRLWRVPPSPSPSLGTRANSDPDHHLSSVLRVLPRARCDANHGMAGSARFPLLGSLLHAR
jgi:hypothetical protein